jgi:hypothetical protein
VAFSRDGDFICSGGADTTLMVWKNNLSGIGYPAKSKFPEDEGLSKPAYIPKKRAKSKTGLKCCKENKNKGNKSSSMNKFSKEENKTNYRNKNPKSTMNSKNSNTNLKKNINLYTSNIKNNPSIKSNGMNLNSINQSNNGMNSNTFVSLPPEMKLTFEKMVSQLDLVLKTVKIFDQRIQSLEGEISTLYNRQKKGFVQKQPPQMGNYQYLLENSNNFMPNNSINNNEVSQKINNQNNFDYYTADIYNSGSNFKEPMNLNDENKKNVFNTEIDINQRNKSSQEELNNDDNMYKGQIKEEYGYNGEEQINEGEEQINEGEEQINEGEEQINEGEEEMIMNNEEEIENMNDQGYEEGQGEEFEEQGEGEEYGGNEEEYVNEQEYGEGEEYVQEQDQENGEEQVYYDYKNDMENDNENNGNKS